MAHVKHLSCVAILAAATASVSAGPVFNLNIEFSGADPPAGATPWVTVSFAQGTGLNLAHVFMTVQNNLVGVEFLSRLLINVDPGNVGSPAAMLPSYVSGTQANDPVSGKLLNPDNSGGMNSNLFKADGDGFFDYRFDWTANTFGGVQTAVYRFDNMTDSWFNFISEPGGGQGQYHAAAHVQGIAIPGPDPTGGSGWVGDFIIPLPTTAGMAFVGLLGLGCVRRRRDL